MDMMTERAAAQAVQPEPIGAGLEAFARPEVKATLRLGETFLLATQHGLLRWTPGEAVEAVPGLPQAEIRALGPAPGGFVAAIGRRLVLADGAGRVEAWIEAPEGEKVAAASAAGGRVLVGTKTGIYGATEGGWERLLGEPGFEVTRLWEQPGRIIAGVKKQGARRLPALAESTDGGVTWTLTEMGDYGDVVLAADARRIVTRWRGARLRGPVRGGYKKHPLSAAELMADGGALVLDGDKAEIAGPGRRKAEIFHPRLAEAEQVALLPQGIFFSGMQGAFLFDPLRHRVTDLLPAPEAGRIHGKRKRLYALDGGAVLATCSFGTFRSTDGGESFQPVDSEWDVLDAEHAARAADGRWFLLCQRGLFVTRDNGARLDYVKPKMPHGSRHYGEFRTLAIGADTLWMGTKQGLFAAPLADPERLAPVAGIPEGSIEALHVTAAGDLLLGIEGQGLLRRDAAGTLRAVAPIDLHEATLMEVGGRLLAVSEGALLDLSGTAPATITPEGAEGPLAMAADADRLLVWSRMAAWQRPVSGGAWQALPGWPAGVRSVALLAGSRALLTDRAHLQRVTLPDVG